MNESNLNECVAVGFCDRASCTVPRMGETPGTLNLTKKAFKPGTHVLGCAGAPLCIGTRDHLSARAHEDKLQLGESTAGACGGWRHPWRLLYLMFF